jgi:hypothetical protein
MLVFFAKLNHYSADSFPSQTLFKSIHIGLHRFFDFSGAGLWPPLFAPESVVFPAIHDARSKFWICAAVFVVPEPRTPFFCISSISAFISGSMFSISLGMPNMSRPEKSAMRIMGFFKKDSGETDVVSFKFQD